MARGGRFSIPIEDIVSLLGLEVSPRSTPGARSMKVHCPFCDHKGYTMDVDTVNRVYHCFHCPDDLQKNTGALDLYSRVRLGKPVSQLDAKDVFKQLMRELEGGSSYDWKRSVTEVRDTNIYPASDAVLSDTYSELLRMFSLSEQHSENLANRGIPKWESGTFGYASLPPSNLEIKRKKSRYAEVEKWFEEKEIWRIRSSNDILKKYSKKDIILGVWIADELLRRGKRLDGVPGFFHITPNRWCFRYDAGMMIPTNSYDGKHVGIQIRRDVLSSKGLRYMTLSSKGLPDGVTANISRVHVARKTSTPIGPDTVVYITEGPMKADIVEWFIKKDDPDADIAIIAVQGVTNVRELPGIARKLREAGVTKVQSAFDMDKCTNIHVIHASKNIRKIFHEAQISVNTLVWDDEYAEEKLQDMMAIAKENGIEFTRSFNQAAFDIAKLSEILASRKIPFNIKIVDGAEKKVAWLDRSKGLDDWLMYLSRASKT